MVPEIMFSNSVWCLKYEVQAELEISGEPSEGYHCECKKTPQMKQYRETWTGRPSKCKRHGAKFASKIKPKLMNGYLGNCTEKIWPYSGKKNMETIQ